MGRIASDWKKAMAAGLLILSAGVFLTGCGAAGSKTPAMTGVAEVREVDVNSKIPGRVVALLVQEGDAVQKGQVIARIDPRDLEAKGNQAQAQIDALEAQLAQAEGLTRLQDQTSQAALAGAKAQVEKAEADWQLAQKAFERIKALVESGAASQQAFDEAQNKLAAAEAARQGAYAALASAQGGLLQGQINRDNVAAVQAKLEQAQGAAQEIALNLAETEIKAPIDGIVTSLNVDEGEMVSAGMPLFTLLDPQENWVILKVRESELAAYPLQSQVLLEGVGGLRLEGRVTDVSKKPEFAAYRATNERGDRDIITYSVKVQTNSPEVRAGMRFTPLGGGGQ